MPNRGNYDNIKDHSFNKITAEEQRKIASQGGKASGKTRQKIRTMRQAAKVIGSMLVVNDDMKKMLAAQGFDPDEMTNIVAIVQSAFIRAIQGDAQALDRIIKLLGEDNDTARLKMEQQKVKEGKKTVSDDGKLNELLEGLKDE